MRPRGEILKITYLAEEPHSENSMIVIGVVLGLVSLLLGSDFTSRETSVPPTLNTLIRKTVAPVAPVSPDLGVESRGLGALSCALGAEFARTRPRMGRVAG